MRIGGVCTGLCTGPFGHGRHPALKFQFSFFSVQEERTHVADFQDDGERLIQAARSVVACDVVSLLTVAWHVRVQRKELSLVLCSDAFIADVNEEWRVCAVSRFI